MLCQSSTPTISALSQVSAHSEWLEIGNCKGVGSNFLYFLFHLTPSRYCLHVQWSKSWQKKNGVTQLYPLVALLRMEQLSRLPENCLDNESRWKSIYPSTQELLSCAKNRCCLPLPEIKPVYLHRELIVVICSFVLSPSSDRENYHRVQSRTVIPREIALIEWQLPEYRFMWLSKSSVFQKSGFQKLLRAFQSVNSVCFLKLDIKSNCHH